MPQGGAGRQERLAELFLDALGGDDVQAGGVGREGVPRRRGDGEAEAGGETDGAQHPQGVVLKGQGGVGRGADDLGI